jgi:GTPase SAR1 family protein
MIIVVEGLSAAGKTTWCHRCAGEYLIKESYPEKRPDRNAGPSEAARLWTEWNAKRWSDAVAMERAKGLAVCDTDPLKLHFSWAMWQIGEASEAHWLAQLGFTREAIRNRRLGFGDRYLFKSINPLDAQQQRDRDTARPRPNFGLHLRLHRSLVRWYETIAKVMPERLVWELPQTLPPIEATVNPHRYDLTLFDRFIGMLPRTEQRL